MELRELWQLLKKERALFGIVVGIFLLGALFWVSFEPERYESNILITIGRTEGSMRVPATDYQYDNFYRLQADERFGDTLVRLLATPQVTKDIFTEAKFEEQLPSGTYFVGRRLSSQIVEVTFVDKDKVKLARLAEQVSPVLNRYTSELEAKNDDQNNWFRVVASEPVIQDARVSEKQIWMIALFLGVFLGFWIVLIKHYIQPDTLR